MERATVSAAFEKIMFHVKHPKDVPAGGRILALHAGAQRFVRLNTPLEAVKHCDVCWSVRCASVTSLAPNLPLFVRADGLLSTPRRWVNVVLAS